MGTEQYIVSACRKGQIRYFSDNLIQSTADRRLATRMSLIEARAFAARYILNCHCDPRPDQSGEVVVPTSIMIEPAE